MLYDGYFLLPTYGQTCHTKREKERESPKMSFMVCCLETIHKQATCYKVAKLPKWILKKVDFKKLPDGTRRKPVAAQIMVECHLQELFFHPHISVIGKLTANRKGVTLVQAKCGL